VVTSARRKTFTEEAVVALLRQAFRVVQVRYPFYVEAAVILPDHFHMIWRLPENESDYPTRWRLIKSDFTRQWEGSAEIPANRSRQLKGERSVWQRRYWEHLIRDDGDLQRHVEYIHYNPVKHGLVRAPIEWRYSSFHNYVRNGMYTSDWGRMEMDMKLDRRME